MLVTIANVVAVETSCISYNTKENEISISCKYANFIDIENELQNQNILYRESNPSHFKEKNWILNTELELKKMQH
jgi:hypothetical protein